MQTNIHRPVAREITTHDRGRLDEFHTIRLRERGEDAGDAVIFIGANWADWDALVAAVAEYRAQKACFPAAVPA
jgi:hypothetical protein